MARGPGVSVGRRQCGSPSSRSATPRAARRTTFGWSRGCAGATRASAQAEMTTIARRLEAIYGADHDGTDASVIPLHDYTVRGSRQLLLDPVRRRRHRAAGHLRERRQHGDRARRTNRQRELALRLALGASRRQARADAPDRECAARGRRRRGRTGRRAGPRPRAGVDGAGEHSAARPGAARRAHDALCDRRARRAHAARLRLWPSLQLARASPRDMLAEGGRLGTRGRRPLHRQGLVALEVASRSSW